VNPSESEHIRPAGARILIIALATAVVLGVVGSMLIAFRLFPRASATEATAQDAREACQKASRKLSINPDGVQWLDAGQWRASGDPSGRWTVTMRYRLTSKEGSSRSGAADCTIQHDRPTNEWRLVDLVEN
jgi:hypothetical protein